MFSDKLFDHKYDIDDLIMAFLGNEKTKLWHLNTYTGEMLPLAENHSVTDGGDNNHTHIIESLPVTFLKELTLHHKFQKLPEDVQAHVVKITSRCAQVHELSAFFHEGEAGSYIVKFIKGACLDWLDMRNLIPPSMRHTSDMSMFDSVMAPKDATGKVKISIK